MKYKKYYVVAYALSILTSIIIIILSVNKFKPNKTIAEKQLNIYIRETSTIDDTKEVKYEPNKPEYNYVAILEIPDINLKNGLVSPSSKYNSVKYNVEILGENNLPTVEKSNLILAAHNGNSEVSYFKDLSKLTTGSIVYIYYNGYKYIYNIDDYYEIEKTGEATITRDGRRNTITLITCKDNTDTKQIVYIGYLIDKEIY